MTRAQSKLATCSRLLANALRPARGEIQIATRKLRQYEYGALPLDNLHIHFRELPIFPYLSFSELSFGAVDLCD